MKRHRSRLSSGSRPTSAQRGSGYGLGRRAPGSFLSVTPAIIRPSVAFCRPAATLADDAAVEHHQDAVGQRADLVELDRHQQDRLAGVAHRDDRLWMNSMAPISTPRVGWPTSSTSGSRSISRASTIFCWLPPEKFAVFSPGWAGGRRIPILPRRRGAGGRGRAAGPAVFLVVLIAEDGVFPLARVGVTGPCAAGPRAHGRARARGRVADRPVVAFERHPCRRAR
jgi:hypothetical protein